MNQLQPWLQSSQDPTQVASKVKGLIIMASSTIIFFVALLFHVSLTPNDIIAEATDISGIIGAILTIYGLILHIITWLGTLRTDSGVPVPVPPVPVTLESTPAQQPAG